MAKDFLRDWNRPDSCETAVILGKGPSFDLYLEREVFRRSCNQIICGINQTIKHVDLDIWAVCHAEIIGACEDFVDRPEVLLMPYYPIYSGGSKTDISISCYDYITKLRNLHCFNAPWHHPQSSSPVAQGFGTTAHHLFHLLVMKGIKEFIFYGVDGGKKAYGKQYYSNNFNHDPKEYFESGKIPADFDDFWKPYFQARRKHGLRLVFA